MAKNKAKTALDAAKALRLSVPNMMKIATLRAAEAGKCERQEYPPVGCLAVDLSGSQPRVRSISVNGPAAGVTCSWDRDPCGCVHAEQRAVVKLMASQSFKPGEVALICTRMPCLRCASLVAETAGYTGVALVVYNHDRDTNHDHDTEIRACGALTAAGVMMLPHWYDVGDLRPLGEILRG